MRRDNARPNPLFIGVSLHQHKVTFLLGSVKPDRLSYNHSVFIQIQEPLKRHAILRVKRDGLGQVTGRDEKPARNHYPFFGISARLEILERVNVIRECVEIGHFSILLNYIHFVNSPTTHLPLITNSTPFNLLILIKKVMSR